MKNFLIKTTAGLFALSLLVAPAFVLAQGGAPSTCTLRTAVDKDEVEVLTGGGAEVAITAGTILPTEAPGGTDALKKVVEDNFALICTFSLIKWVSNLIFLIVGILSVLLISVSAVLFLMAAGRPDMLGKAKNFLIFSAVGIVVAAFANFIPAIIRGFLGA